MLFKQCKIEEKWLYLFKSYHIDRILIKFTNFLYMSDLGLEQRNYFNWMITSTSDYIERILLYYFVLNLHQS